MIRLHVISPVVQGPPRTAAEFGALVDRDVSFSAELLTVGPDCIECEADEARAVPEVVARAVAAEAEGADAIIVDCFGDPGVLEARCAVRIPVFGPGQAAMSLATMLGSRFAVVTVLGSVFGMISRMAERYGVANRMAPMRAVDIPVLELERDAARLGQALAREAIGAVRRDHADIIVLGCTGMQGTADALAQTLLSELGLCVPVIDPLPAAAALAIGCARMRLSHSQPPNHP